MSCLKRFKQGLKHGGVICIKDNVAGKEAVFDDNDSSVTRQVLDCVHTMPAHFENGEKSDGSKI